MIRVAVAVGWAMTGGQDRGAAFRRAVVGTACRIPGVTAAVGRDLSPALTAGPLVRRRPRLTGRMLAGTFCPQPWVRHDGRRVRLDDVLGDSFAVLTAVPPTAQMTAVATALGAPTIRVDDLGDDGTLAGWLARGRVDAVLLRPDRVVMDTVPAGTSDFTDTGVWAPCCTRPAIPPTPGPPDEELHTMTTPRPEAYPEPFFTSRPEVGRPQSHRGLRPMGGPAPGRRRIQDPTDYRALYEWSVTDLEGFWAAVWEYFDIDATTEYERVLAEETMHGARWFPGATSTTPITRCATCSPMLPRSPPWTRPEPPMRSRAGSCAPGSPPSLPACATWASDRATEWWAICPTPPRRHRLPRHRKPWRGVVGMRPGLRTQGRRRPLRAARTDRAHHR